MFSFEGFIFLQFMSTPINRLMKLVGLLFYNGCGLNLFLLNVSHTVLSPGCCEL